MTEPLEKKLENSDTINRTINCRMIDFVPLAGILTYFCRMKDFDEKTYGKPIELNENQFYDQNSLSIFMGAYHTAAAIILFS
ncbi:MAG TPA: hypothetical protein VJB94_00325 [Candidatus Nanoarchaeia archaeon]|nr:hypothetical protein [Candidatus Nanoarchaeia archaeon]